MILAVYYFDVEEDLILCSGMLGSPCWITFYSVNTTRSFTMKDASWSKLIAIALSRLSTVTCFVGP